jgi:selenocysteine lyase/cysteine desulfurase
MALATGTVLQLRDQFTPRGTYLDSATFGLPPRAAREAFAAVTADWATGVYDPLEADAAITRSRAAFAVLAGVDAGTVAVGHQVSPFVGLLAAALPDGAQVLVPEEEFTSLLFPLLVQRERGVEVRTVPRDALAEAVDARTDLVAFSAVASQDGHVINVAAIAAAARHHGALSACDATQACGWLPLEGAELDLVVAGTYKWLLSPRGTALCALSEALQDRLVAHTAGWYGAQDPWASCYGRPLRQAEGARRFDVSPAWLSWHATAAALELLAETGVAAIHAHDVALADRLRAGLGVEPSGSAIVSLELGEAAAARLRDAGVRCSQRAGRVRLSVHVHNDAADVDRALEALAGQAPVGR